MSDSTREGDGATAGVAVAIATVGVALAPGVALATAALGEALATVLAAGGGGDAGVAVAGGEVFSVGEYDDAGHRAGNARERARAV